MISRPIYVFFSHSEPAKCFRLIDVKITQLSSKNEQVTSGIRKEVRNIATREHFLVMIGSRKVKPNRNSQAKNKQK
jgi:hypothetical protein